MATVPVYERPKPSEYAPYQQAYVNLVPEADVLKGLEIQVRETITLFESLPDSRGDYAYAPGKWTIKEVLGHVCDTERVLGYRALRIARGDTTPLASFDQDAWAAGSSCARRTIADLLAEFGTIRQATISLLQYLDPAVLLRRGETTTGNAFTVRALAYVIVGHGRHHLRIIRERYL